MYMDQEIQDEFPLSHAGSGLPRKLPRTLPVLPVRDTVYFPHMLFPLFLGREKSIRALDYALEKHRYLLLVAQKEVSVEDPTPDDIYTVGTVAEVMQVLRVPDGTVRVTLEGIDRAKITKYLHTDPFFKANIKVISSPPIEGPKAEALMRSVTSLFDQIVQNQGGYNGRPIPPELLMSVASIDDPGKLVNTIIPYLPLKTEIKQEVLETVDDGKRLEMLNSLLQKEMEVLEIQRNIRGRVEKEMGDMQREYILREQLKAIQQELGDRDGRASELEDYKSRIAEAKMPEEVNEKSLKELDRLDKMPYASPEGTVIRNYLDWLISLPWDKRSQESLDIDAAEKVLNADHFGLDKVKERVIEFLAVRKLSREIKGPILCFVGPPGVGKTSIGKSIARSLGRKFYRLSLGGVRDEAEIRGHRRTYVGAMPGRIIQGIKQAGTRNPVFMLDEIDKIGADFRGDPSAALLETLDPEQNHSFSDHYLEVPFDLRDVMFITTANVLESIPPALRDRMEVIRFSGYIEDEKVQIAKRFLIPKQVKENGLTSDLLSLHDSAVRLIIREYTREAGVRNLERCIGAICRKVAREVASGKIKKTTVREKDVKTYLGMRKFHFGRAEEKDEIAAATGLVYTEFGGDVISIEAVLMSSPKGSLALTGQLGDVMKESGQTALTYVRSRAKMLGLGENFYSSSDIHVHVPEGAVPKDGPSAGVTIAVAIASALTKRPIRKDIAMTGEITLRGRVLPIGGVKEKVLAAHRAGIRAVILPKDNENDLEDIPADVRKEMTFHLVGHADEVLGIALISTSTEEVPQSPPV
ncbi:MAG: endopeptidase La [Armatimonadetes bacterium]|nr:endopeptidase La [Armatimonadota bacterium]